MADMFGNSPTIILESALFASVGGTITQIAVSSIGYVAAAGWALGDLIFNRGKGAWADMCNINWNSFSMEEWGQNPLGSCLQVCWADRR